MYSDPGMGQGRCRDRIQSDSGLARDVGAGAGGERSTASTSRSAAALPSPSSRDTLSSFEQFSPQRAAYSEGEWNADDTDGDSGGGGASGGGTPDWELRTTVAKLKKMSLRTFRLWR